MLEGIKNVGEQPTTYTMEQLGIKPGSREASIFNQIDAKDGTTSGFLTEEQYSEYQRLLGTIEETQLDTESDSLLNKVIKFFQNASKANTEAETQALNNIDDKLFGNTD